MMNVLGLEHVKDSPIGETIGNNFLVDHHDEQ